MHCHSPTGNNRRSEVTTNRISPLECGNLEVTQSAQLLVGRDEDVGYHGSQSCDQQEGNSRLPSLMSTRAQAMPQSQKPSEDNQNLLIDIKVIKFNILHGTLAYTHVGGYDATYRPTLPFFVVTASERQL